jgi:ribosomal protein S18 acetylase RimI-like enzyme
MSITLARLADLDELVPLFAGYLDFYEVPAAEPSIRAFLGERLERHESVIYLARSIDGLALGFVQLYPFFASLALRPAWLVSDLYVMPAARRGGHGEALMNAARAHAEATARCGLQLETAKTNHAGQALYERLGYQRDERFYTYWLELPASPVRFRRRGAAHLQENAMQHLVLTVIAPTSRGWWNGSPSASPRTAATGWKAACRAWPGVRGILRVAVPAEATTNWWRACKAWPTGHPRAAGGGGIEPSCNWKPIHLDLVGMTAPASSAISPACWPSTASTWSA